MKRKRILALILIFVMVLTVACSGKENESKEGEEKTLIKIGALKGPTGMGLAGLEKVKKDNYDYEISIYNSPDEIVPKIVSKDLDIAFVPSNLGSVLYNKTEGNISALSISTLGVLYIVENGDSIKSIGDLEGKTIYGSGKNATPEFAMNYLMDELGLKDVKVEWKSEHSEALQAMMKEENGLALLPQPFVTTAQMKNENINIALDITEEWEKIQGEKDEKSALVMGIAIGNDDFIKENPTSVDRFLKDYRDSVEFVNSNVKEASEIIGKMDIVPKEVSERAIEYSNIVSINGDEKKEKLEGYLKVLFSQDEKSVGGKLPGEDFYEIFE